MKSTSISYGESRGDRWASNSVTTSVSTVLTTIFLKPLRRKCFTWTMIVAALRNNINKEGNLDVTQKTGK